MSLKNVALGVISLLFFQTQFIGIAQATVNASNIYSLGYPIGLAEDLSGNIYIADDHNSDASKRGIVVIPAADGNLFGNFVTSGAPFQLFADSNPGGVAIGPTGELFWSLSGNGAIYVLSEESKTIFGVSVTANSPTLIASGTALGGPLEFDSLGNLYGLKVAENSIGILPVASGNLYGNTVVANTPTQIAIGTGWFWDLAIDSMDNIFVSDGWGLHGLFVLPIQSGSLLGQSVTANVFVRITAGGSLYFAGIDIDSSDNIFINQYSGLTYVLTPTNTTIFNQAISPLQLTAISSTSGYVDQGLLVSRTGALILGGPAATYKLVSIPTTTAPDAPTIGTATALSPTSASISFTAPTSNGGATIETYTATSIPGSFTGQILQAGSGTITVTGLTASTAYTFTVTASNSAGTSSPSSASTSITMPASDEELAAQAAQAAAAREAAAQAASEAAATKRESEKKSARSEISNKFKGSEKVTIETFSQAEIAGITEDNIESLQNEILALSEESRSDIAQVIKVARKYEVVGKIASNQVSTVLPNTYIEIGLIPEDSKNKSALTYTIRRLAEGDRIDYATVQAAIDSEIAIIQARKDRLAAVIARNAARNLDR